jgi:hypothetical protein
MSWQSGDRVELRRRRMGVVSWGFPVKIVERSNDRIALYRAPDTRIKRPVPPDGGSIPRSLPYEERFRLPGRAPDVLTTTSSRQIRPSTAHRRRAAVALEGRGRV